jgi:hypothetical protein
MASDMSPHKAQTHVLTTDDRLTYHDGSMMGGDGRSASAGTAVLFDDEVV